MAKFPRCLIEDFRPRERQENVSAAACDDELLVNRIQGHSRWRNSRDLPDWNFPARWSVTAIVNAPGADPAAKRAGDDPAFRRIRLDLADTAECRVRSLDDAKGFRVSIRSAIASRENTRTFGPATGMMISP